MPKQRPLSVTEASVARGIPKRTLQYAISTGSLKAQKLPGATGAYLIDARELDRWLAKREARTA